jgi:hypothetical protein
MAKKVHTIALAAIFAATAIAAAIFTVKAAGLPPRKKVAFDAPWHKKPAPNAVLTHEREYDDTRVIETATMRLHRAADGYVLFARSVEPEEEQLLLQQGFRLEKHAAAVRDHSIHDHEVYVGYMVGQGGPTSDQLKRLQGTTVKAAFKAYRGIGAPMIVDVAPHRP